MRINIYPGELTDHVEMVEQSGHTGLRLYLRSPDELTPRQQSAITFWDVRKLWELAEPICTMTAAEVTKPHEPELK